MTDLSEEQNITSKMGLNLSKHYEENRYDLGNILAKLRIELQYDRYC